MTDLAFAALGALGPAPTGAELALVAKALRDSDDEETLALFYDQQAYGDGSNRLVELAERAGTSGFVALDLCVEVVNPGALADVRGAAR
jgi:hypothetical protein